MGRMTPEQQRIKIAEACGWIPNPKPHTAKILDWLHVPSGNASYDPPNYPEDLNAMNEAEKTLSENDEQKYLDILADAPRNDRYLTWADSVFATAAQRAEAFLKTLNLWEES
jgi:hypothetical protein